MAVVGLEAIRRRFPVQSRFFFYALLLFILYMTWLVLRPFVIYTFAGIFVAVLALPIDDLWERALGKERQKNARKMKRRDRLAAGATILTLFVFLTVPLGLLGWALASETQEFARSIQGGSLDEGMDNVLDIVAPDQTPEERNATRAQIWSSVGQRAREIATDMATRAVGIVGEVFIAITVILFVVYYLLIDGQQLLGYLRRIAPLPPTQFDYLLQEAHKGLVAVFVGQMLTSAIQGAIAGIGYFIAQLPGALLWAIVTAAASLIPAVGTAIVWVPASLYLLVTGHYWAAGFLALWGFVVVAQIDNIIRPKLIGARSQIHPVFVLIGVLGGVVAFGFIGLFLGPLLVGVALSVLRVWERDYKDPEIATAGAEPPPAPDPPADVEKKPA